MTEPRTKRVSPSNPALEARGWDRDDPTLVLEKSLCEVSRTARVAEAACGVTSALRERSRTRLNQTLDRVLEKTGT
jgi:hypothetical protein